MDQLDIAIHSTVMLPKGRLTWLAKLMKVSAAVLRSKANYNTKTHKLTLREAFTIMQLTEDIQILQVMAHALGFKLVPLSVTAADSPLAAVLNVNSEIGDVHRVLQQSLAGRTITYRQLAAIRKEVEEAIHSLKVLVETVAAISADTLGVADA